MTTPTTLSEAFDQVPPATVNGEPVQLVGGALPTELQPHRGKAATPKSRDDWQTPPEFLDGLGQRWFFVLDAACSRANAVAGHGLTAEQDGLIASWSTRLGVITDCYCDPLSPARQVLPPWLDREGPGGLKRAAVWANPPYGRRGELSRAFVARAAQQAREICGPNGHDVVMLLAATPDTRWFHDVALHPEHGCDEVWFTKGRLAFVNPDTGEPARNNGGGSVLLVWRAGWTPRTGAPFLGSIGKDGTPTATGGW